MKTMKQATKILSIALSSLLFVCCTEFTDLQPKGANILSTTDDLEMLLNCEWYFYSNDVREIGGDIIYAYSPIANELARPNKTKAAMLYTWDSSDMDHYADLTSSDDYYQDMYGGIGKVCNPILSRIKEAKGDKEKANQLQAEALTLRAYFHWMLANKFAKPYDPATAANTPAIIYMTEDVDITVPQQKKTLAEVYDLLIADIEAAEKLMEYVPVKAVSHMRINRACIPAVKALILLSKQDWDGASAAAKKALDITGAIDNYNNMLTQKITGYIIGNTYDALLLPKDGTEGDLFFTYNIEFYDSVVPEFEKLIEPGNLALSGLANFEMMYDYMVEMLGVKAIGELLHGLPYKTVTYDLESGWNCAGVKTSYLYCLLAECEWHKGNYDAAMSYLDELRKNRIATAMYSPLEGTGVDAAKAMNHIKETWSGEGIWSFYNYFNRKRWNGVKGWEATYSKEMLGKTYTLAPNDAIWVAPFPKNATSMNPNLTQNYK